MNNAPINYLDPTGHFTVSMNAVGGADGGGGGRSQTNNQPSSLTQHQVRQVQDRLRLLGYRGQSNSNLQTTGSLNVHTNHALAHFRRMNNLAAATVLRSGDATWNRLFGNGIPAPLIGPDWHNVHTRLRDLGYRAQNGSALPIATARTNNTNHALAQFRQRNNLNATTNFNRLDATWNRLFSTNARSAPVVNTSGGGTTTPRPPVPPQSIQERSPIATTPNNNRQTTNQQNSGTAQNNTPIRCPQQEADRNGIPKGPRIGIPYTGEIGVTWVRDTRSARNGGSPLTFGELMTGYVAEVNYLTWATVASMLALSSGINVFEEVVTALATGIAADALSRLILGAIGVTGIAATITAHVVVAVVAVSWVVLRHINRERLLSRFRTMTFNSTTQFIRSDLHATGALSSNPFMPRSFEVVNITGGFIPYPFPILSGNWHIGITSVFRSMY